MHFIRLKFSKLYIFLFMFVLLLQGAFRAYSETIRIGEYDTYNELHDIAFTDSRNFDKTFLKYMADAAGWKYEYYPASFEDCLKNLDNGTIDILTGIPKVSAYESKYLFVEPMYSMTCSLLTAQLSNTEYYSGSIKELDGAAVGISGKQPYLQRFLQDFASSNGIHLSVIIYPTLTELEKNFDSGRVKLKFVTERSLPFGEKIIHNFGPCPQYIITAKSNRKMQREMQDGIADLFKNNAFQVFHEQEVCSDFALLSVPDMTPLERRFITGAPPVCFSGTMNISDIWGYIQQVSGLKFKYELQTPNAIDFEVYSVKVMPLPDYIDVSTMNDCTVPVFKMTDWIIPGHGVSPEKLQKNQISGNMQGKLKLALTRDQFDLIPYFKDKLNTFEAVYFDSFSECLNAISDSECDAAIIPDFLLGASYNLSDYPELHKSMLMRYTVPYHFYVTGDSSGTLVSILNKSIKMMPGDLFDNQFRKLAKQFPYHPGRSVLRARKIVYAEIILAIMILSYVIYRLRRSYYYKKWAFSDELTGLWNSRRFEIEADKILRKNPNHNYALIESDIRGFKYINKVYGSAYGDRSLVFYAQCLKKCQLPDMYIARGYADRFYIMFPIESLDDCSRKCMQIFTWCNSEAAARGFHYVIKDGVALAGKDFGADTVQNLIGKASYAKYTIKRDLVNSIALFDEKMHRQMSFDQQIESCMDKAFDNEEFFVMYQPKIDLKTGTITGAEALVRWNSPENGLLLPDNFMSVLEKNGYIIKLDFYVYRMVFEFIQNMLDQGQPMVPVSVNMSRFHLNAPDFIKKFTDLYRMFHIPASYIEIEVIERATGQNDTLLINVTKQLQKEGFIVAMDDFGSGESSLNMLHTVPVNVLKVDKDFLYRAEDSTDSKVIITKVMEMAKELGKETVCEGVETVQQVEFLKSIGCDMAQGYYYSKPLSENDFKQYLQKHIRQENKD